jgi:N-acetylmuramoyl-L-alanine amidase
MKEADTVGTYGPSSATHEYELTMRVSQKLRTELEKRGYTVRLTHLDTVRPISCVERAQVANENEADAFIRIHANGVEDTSASGAMTICITQDNPFHPELYKASYRLSETLLDAYCAGTGARREKVWETDTMTGNNWSEVPATLIELGYMTNSKEDALMQTSAYQKKMLAGLVNGIDEYFKKTAD